MSAWSRLRSFSIRSKLIFSQLLIVMLVLVINNATTFYFDVKSHRESIILRLHSTTGIIALNVTSSLLFRDPDSANEILQALSNEKEVLNAWIYDLEGNLFSTYSRNPDDGFTFPRMKTGAPVFQGNFAYLILPVEKDGENYGTVHLRMDTTGYKKSVHRSFLVLLGSLLIGMLVALLLSMASQQFFTSPINNLILTIDQIIETKRYSEPLKNPYEDEIGKLYDAFHLMMDKINQRDKDRDDVIAALKTSENSLRNAQELANMGNWEYDLSTHEVTWSDQIYQIFDIKDHSMTEERFMALIHPDDRDYVTTVFSQATESRKTATIEYRIITETGKLRYVLDTGSEIKDELGKTSKLVGTIQDITEIKQTEEALKKLNEELEERVQERTLELEIAKEKAEESDRLKSAFLASMSHELRTPLNSIIGFTGILLQGLVGPLNPEQQKQLGMVKNSSQHLLNLINDVLDISKIEAGQMTVETQPFSIRKSLETTYEILRHHAEKKGLLFTLEIGDEIEIIQSDQRRVEQILLNLINNAIKFTEKGSVKVEAEIDEQKISVHIKDTGIGIGEKDLNKLFKPFQQVETGLSRKFEGTGLGLSICKKLLLLLKGDIAVTSVTGEGSCFTFWLPLDHGGKDE